MMLKVIISVWLVTSTSAFIIPDSLAMESVSYFSKVQPSYSSRHNFAWSVKDDYNDYAHREEGSSRAVTGSYHVLLPDGRTQIVNYKADENGYIAEVNYDDYNYVEEDSVSPKASAYWETIDMPDDPWLEDYSTDAFAGLFEDPAFTEDEDSLNELEPVTLPFIEDHYIFGDDLLGVDSRPNGAQD